MSQYGHSPYSEYNNNYNSISNNNLPQRVNQRIQQHQPSVPNMLRNDVSPRFSISPVNQNKQPVSNNSRWLPNLDQPLQQKQRDVSPNKLLNKVCNDCSMRLFQERVLNQRIDDLQQQNQRLQKELDNANKQILLHASQSDQYKKEIEQLKNKKEEYNIAPVYQRFQNFQDQQNRDPRSKSDNRSYPQNKLQSQKSFILYTCRLDEQYIESYYQNQQINKINFLINRQDPQWDCLVSQNAVIQQNGLNYHQIQRKTRLDECYLLKGKINNQSFSSSKEAAQQLLPQLLAKYFLNLYYKELKNKCQYQIPQFNYPELFILEELDKKNYWIAEKKYNEPHTRYITNKGEIYNSSQNENLSFLISFSFFTLYTTEGNYMIIDIQGYGQNLTEPSIISQTTEKLLNDQGLDKIRRFLVKFQELKLGYKYLDALQMDYKK